MKQLKLKKKIYDEVPVKHLQQYGKKGIAILLVVMLVFTIISRVTYSFTVAKVVVDSSETRKIEHMVIAEGMVEKNREMAVITQANIIVKTVYVVSGQKIKEGELLAEVDMDDLQEQISQIKSEIQILELQNQAENSNAKVLKDAKQTQINRANEDYNKAVQSNNERVSSMEAALQSAKEALATYENSPDMEETQREALAVTVTSAQAAYDDAINTRDSEMLAAQRNVENANTTEGTNNTISINNISISEKTKQLEKLEKLQQQEGKITADCTGVITNVYLMTGQKTSNTAAFTLADLSSGMRFIAQISKADAKYVAAGDEVELSTVNKKVSKLFIDTVEVSEDGQTLTVTVMLSADELSIGDTATMKTVKQTEQFGVTVPLTAVYEDNGKYYVYILAKVDTVLGNQYVAERRDVEIEDKNDLYAALKNTALTKEDQIIVDSDRYISTGAKVRLWEE